MLFLLERGDQPGQRDDPKMPQLMNTTSVLLANEPRAYRDTIAVALRLLRPKIEVIVTDPERLDDAIALHAPQVVVCSYLTTLVETRVPTWVVLYPDGALVALRSIDGERTTVSEIDLDGILSLIDQTSPLADVQPVCAIDRTDVDGTPISPPDDPTSTRDSTSV